MSRLLQCFLLVLNHFVAYFLVFPIVLFLVVINEFLRLFVSFFLLISDKKYSLISHGSSSFFVSHAFKNKFEFSVLKSCGTQSVEIEKEINLWNNKVLSDKGFEKLKKTVEIRCGYACWRDDGEVFNVRNHVKYWKSKDDEVSEVELYEDILSDLSKDKGDVTKPQWEWVLIPRVRMENGTQNSVRIFKIHHAYLDGAHHSNLISCRLFDFPEGVKNPVIFTYTYQPLLERLWSWVLALLVILLLPGIFVREGFQGGSGKAPDTTFQTESGRNLIFGSVSIDKEAVKRIGKERGLNTLSTIVDLLRPGLYSIWRRRGSKQINAKNEELEAAVVTAVPPLDQSHPMRNRLSSWRFKIPLVSLQPEIDGKIVPPSQILAVYAYHTAKCFGRFPLFLRDFMTRTFPSGAYALISYLPCTKIKAEINGSLVEKWEGFTPINPSTGFGLLILGYGPHHSVNITVDDSVFSKEDLAQILNEVRRRIGI